MFTETLLHTGRRAEIEFVMSVIF